MASRNTTSTFFARFGSGRGVIRHAAVLRAHFLELAKGFLERRISNTYLVSEELSVAKSPW